MRGWSGTAFCFSFFSFLCFLCICVPVLYYLSVKAASIDRYSCLFAGTDLGVTRVTSHPLARQPISCYACDLGLCYFDVVFVPLLEPNPGDAIAPRSCVQLLAQTPSMLARFARSGSQSHPALKHPRSANALAACLCYFTILVLYCVCF